jgi:hypothetical protein
MDATSQRAIAANRSSVFCLARIAKMSEQLFYAARRRSGVFEKSCCPPLFAPFAAAEKHPRRIREKAATIGVTCRVSTFRILNAEKIFRRPHRFHPVSPAGKNP